MTHDLDQLVAALKGSWPSNWTGSSAPGRTLELLINEARRGLVTSLPFVRASNGDVVWLTFGPKARAIAEYIGEDLRVWLPQSDRDRLVTQFVASEQASGSTGPLLKKLAPEGYFRWEIRGARSEQTLSRLEAMHRFLASRPENLSPQTPSLSALRLAFVTALRTGNWDDATACIDEIDRWSLDQATRTLQMRVRLFDAQEDDSNLYQFVVRHQLWELPHPRRIAAAILRAIDAKAIKPIEASSGVDSALMHFRKDWYPRVTQAIADTKGMVEVERIHAYAACADRDLVTLTTLASGAESDLVRRLSALLAPSTLGSPPDLSPRHTHPPVAKPQDIEIGPRFWTALHDAVREGRPDRTRVLIAALDSDLLDDVQFLSRSPDALLELLSDPDIDGRPASRLLLQEVVAGLVDGFVVALGFPRIAHLDVYLSLMEGLVLLRGEAANEADSQLVIGLLGAISQLSPRTCARCESIIRSWWRQRPVISRLGWLATALDSLAALHPRPESMIDLYIDALELAARKSHSLEDRDAWMWRRIGAALELDDNSIDGLVKPLERPSTEEAVDPLATAALNQIAIVSLQESSACEAAKELAERTNARVTVVTSLVSDGNTRQASGSDLILYVWAASTHATYRAFDFDRERLEYVQGTGTSSIIAAAERWVRRQALRA